MAFKILGCFTGRVRALIYGLTRGRDFCSIRAHVKAVALSPVGPGRNRGITCPPRYLTCLIPLM